MFYDLFFIVFYLVYFVVNISNSTLSCFFLSTWHALRSFFEEIKWVVANRLNRISQTVDKGWVFCLEFGQCIAKNGFLGTTSAQEK